MINLINYLFKFISSHKFMIFKIFKLITGDWGLGIGDWGLGIGDWAQSPIPNPQSPLITKYIYILQITIKIN